MAFTQNRSRPRFPASLLVLGSVLSIQFGQAFGKDMFSLVGSAAGVAFLRLAFAAAILLVIWRPRLPQDRASWLLTIGFGTAIAGMNLIYPAMQYLPLGMATSLQLLGPLCLALATSLRKVDFLWSILAIGGVALFYLPRGTEFSLPGLLFALASGLAMALYLLLSKRSGGACGDGSFLALAVTWAALLYMPAGLTQSGFEFLSAEVAAVGLALAVLSAVVPYSLDQAALRRLPPRLVGVLESLEPVVAGIAGVIVLQEYLQPLQWLAIACISLASLGAISSEAGRKGSGATD
ncbi:EamA family transporter [Chelativorans sp. YIM 93263]|uniref:EamA family transporter n=1 Tax=Chelativorans sp. YIM 93263 TaxID=2906648 RepID=UPI002378477F|nr:EamA family transporter [Chelativorans sp. YIM 93263]